MTDQEMAESLKAKGWRVEEPWTKENCEHPHHARIGQGALGTDGSGSMSWACQKCGHSESRSWPANPSRASDGWGQI